jgi:glycosyltransferase involved in cell wall biosynthesis
MVEIPRVSIGLPVYNGENYLSEAIESVLQQTYADFELVVSDNASTDRTGEICRDYAASDSRIRYLRNQENIGAPKNYDLVWANSSGRYFKWLAHDDRLKPGYLAATVPALESNAAIVLCHTVIEYIDEHGEHLGFYRSVAQDCGSDDPAERFATMILRLHTCVDFFGVMPRRVTENSLLHQAFRSADRAFLAQIALRGPFLQLDEPLVQMRQHPQQYSQLSNIRDQLKFNNPGATRKSELSILMLFRCYQQLVEQESLSDSQRLACRNVLRRFWFQGWPVARLAGELLSIPIPQAASAFRAVAIRLGLSGAPKDFSK